jgi:hypothetical protein
MTKRKWITARTETLPPCIPYESDLWIWSRYALTLEINSHCAEAFDDETVSDALQKVRTRIPLIECFEHS